jgi:hypothetical protein
LIQFIDANCIPSQTKNDGILPEDLNEEDLAALKEAENLESGPKPLIENKQPDLFTEQASIFQH